MKTLIPAVTRVFMRLHYPLGMIAKGQINSDDGRHCSFTEQFYDLVK
jgi:hypothetical protein